MSSLFSWVDCERRWVGCEAPRRERCGDIGEEWQRSRRPAAAAAIRPRKQAGHDTSVLRAFAFVLLVMLGGAACAQEGLDLAVLLDRSTSMAGHSRNNNVLLRMTLELIARNAAANRIEHRLAVIGFGSSATVEIPFTSVRGHESQESLRRRIESLRYQDRGDTDVLAALVVAERLFRALPASAERRRAIVLVTDGVPYVRGVNMNTYRAQLRRFVARQFRQPGVTIDVLLLDSRNSAMWRELGRVEAVADRPDRLLPQAHGTIARLVGTRTAETAVAKTNPAIDTLIVPPYLDTIVFDIFRASAGSSVDVFSPGSPTPIRAGTGGIESIELGDVLATLVIPSPAPGEWTIHKSRSDARVRILSQQFFPRGVLLRPAETDALRRCDRIAIVYRVLDGSGHPFEELPGYALAMEVTLAKPDGASATIGMERESDLGAGAFRSAQDVLCDLAGRYWTDVRITTIDVSGRRLDVFRDRWSGFSVMPGDCKPRPVPTKTRTLRRVPARTLLIAAFLVVAMACAAWMWRKTKS